MKKLFRFFTIALIIFTMFLSVVACKQDDGGNNDNENTETEKVFYNVNEKEVVNAGTSVLYANRLTDYKIVIPNGGDSSYNYAAQELQFFVNEASGGAILPIITDEGIVFNENDKYISIGPTTIMQGAGVTLNKSILNTEGFIIKTFKNTVVIAACGLNGNIYGVYGFLERNLGYKFYDEGCYKLNYSNSCVLNEYDVCDIPTFIGRHLDTQTMSYRNVNYYTRMRCHGRQSTEIVYGEGSAWSGLGDQSMAQQIIPYDEYKDNEGWYSGDMKNGQMCISKILVDDYMYGTFLNNLINNFIIPQSKKTIFFLGLNDNSGKCMCADCATAYATIKESGLMVKLANKVAESIDSWQNDLPDNDPNKTRTIRIGFFAYIYTVAAPTVYDSTTNTYSPINNSVIPRDDVFVRIATINSVNMYPHYNKQVNPTAYQSFESWKSITSNIAVWDYGTSFDNYLSPYPDWATIRENMLYYRECGVFDILTQLPNNTTGGSFYAYQIFLRSELMWDVDQDVNDLTEDFFKNYYGEASNVMLNYLEYLRCHYQQLNQDKIYTGAHTYQSLTSRDVWSIAQVRIANKFLNDAISALEPLKATNQTRYETLLTRIQTETLFVKYMFIEVYSDYFTKQELSTLIDDFEAVVKKAGVSYTAANKQTAINDVIKAWREAL